MKCPLILLGVAMVVAGCAETLKGAQDLAAQGYTRTIGLQEGQGFELWTKEGQEGGRTLHVCVIPRDGHRAFFWFIRVFIDDREVWGYDAGSPPGGPMTLRGQACAASTPLPSGRRFHMSVSFRDLE